MRRVSSAIAVGAVMLLALTSAAASDEPADVCLTVAGGLGDEALPTYVDLVSQVVAQNDALFPEPTIATTETGLDIHSGHSELPARSGQPCLMHEFDWTARFARDFLLEGAELMLEQASKTPGFESSIELDWFPADARVRSTLTFSGPFGIPKGTCWIDDALSIEPESGRAVASGERGMDVSPLGDVVCARFYDNLPDGGAGEQAVSLLPTEVPLGDGQALRFVAETVHVSDDAVVVAGTLRLDHGSG